MLYGAAYNVYVRAVRLALAEKGVDYQLIELDLGAEEGAPANYLHHANFMRIPAFEHAGERLYEASAITRYIDEAFDGPALMPDNARARARVNQVISIIENYGYRPMVWSIFIERCRAVVSGRLADEDKIAAAVPQVAYALDALEEMTQGPHLIGEALTLADLHLAAMLAYGTLAPEGASTSVAPAALVGGDEEPSQHARHALAAGRISRYFENVLVRSVKICASGSSANLYSM